MTLVTRLHDQTATSKAFSVYAPARTIIRLLVRQRLIFAGQSLTVKNMIDHKDFEAPYAQLGWSLHHHQATAI
jgi:hypothetical protein